MDKKKKKTILILAIIFLFVVAFLITGGFFLKKKLDSKKDKQVENKVTITFDLGGGTGTFDPLKINKGETISKPSSVPEKPGFTFKHWSSEINGSEFNFSTAINDNLILYAVYEAIPKVTVTFDLQGGIGTFDSITINKGETIIKPSTNPTKPDNIFKYWSNEIGGSEFNFTNPINESLTLYAVWEAIPKVTVTFDLQGGTGTFNPITVNKGETITKPSTNPVKSGFVFKHWSTEINGSEFDFSTSINNSLTLYSVYEAIPKVTVTFDLQGGTGTFDPITVNKGETITKPSTNPTKLGHNFKHWSTEIGGSGFDFITAINENLTLYAVWELQTKTVTFITYEGEEMDETTLTGAPAAVTSQTVNYGSLLDNTGEMLFLTAVSHTFKYWSKTKNGPEFNVRTETITEDLTLHAVWEAKKYTVTFNTQYDLITIPSQTVKHGKEATDPRTTGTVMYRPGYVLKFFSLSEDGLTGEYNFTNKVTEAITIYAVWEKEPVKQMALGNEHTLILTSNNKLYVSGNNQYGQLGLGDNEKRSTLTEVSSDYYNNKTIKQIAAGGNHSLILTEDGEVYAFGRNDKGQLGLGDRNDRNVPTKLNSSNYDNKKIIQVSIGTAHSLILTEDGKIYSFGDNSTGQLGLGNVLGKIVPTKIDSSHYGNKKIVQVIAGGAHSFILTEGGEVYAFGNNGFGRLGLGDNNIRKFPTKIDSSHYGDKKIVQVIAGGAHSFVITEDNDIYAFGYNGNGQLGLNDTADRNIPTKLDSTNYDNKTIAQITAGGYHTLIRTTDGEVYAFGNNGFGQLGLGDNEKRLVPTKLDGANYDNKSVVQIAAGGFHSAILTLNSKIYTFGQNNFGQLGLGDNENHSVPKEIN